MSNVVEEKKEGKTVSAVAQQGLSPLLLGVIALIVLFLLINVGLYLSSSSNPNPAISPDSNANVRSPVTRSEALLILPDNCAQCRDLNALLDQLSLLDINFSTRSLVLGQDAEAQTTVDRFAITKLPGLVLLANPIDFALLSEQWTGIGDVRSDLNTLVLRENRPPFFDLSTQTVRGLVEFWSIGKANCPECVAPVSRENVESLGIFVASEHQWTDENAEAQALLAQYAITKLPAVVLSSEISAYSGLASVLEPSGSFESNGAWVMRYPVPYYWDLNENRLAGGLSLTRLDYNACENCFDLNELEAFLVDNFGLKVASDQNLDWSTPEGKQLAQDYNISFVPTLVIGGELSAYRGLLDTWQSFGTLVSDGNWVFSGHEQLSPNYVFFDVNAQVERSPPSAETAE